MIEDTTTPTNSQPVGAPVEPSVGRLVDCVTDEDIQIAFLGTNFGRTDHRRLLALSVLKKALKYHCGHTVTQIMVKMGLTTEKGNVTNKGRIFCYEELGARDSG